MKFRGGSDHKLLRITRFINSMKKSLRYVRKRSFKNFNQEQFCDAVKKISWYDLYMCEDQSQAAELLTQKMATFQIWVKYAPWMSKTIKDLLKVRKTDRTKSPKDWLAYKDIRNNASAKMR
jgi:hypothetical protein